MLNQIEFLKSQAQQMRAERYISELVGDTIGTDNTTVVSTVPAAISIRIHFNKAVIVITEQ